MASNRELSCPACGSQDVAEQWEDDVFDYGSGENAAKLSTLVPVCRCRNCGLDYTDDRAEKNRHAAVCRHLRILSPEEVLAIRERHMLTQQDFAAISGVGRASLARWEVGSIFQNTSSDDLLLLLGFAENLERLQRRHEAPIEAPAMPAAGRRFRTIGEDETLQLNREAASFSLFPRH
jgi:putative zinc finger/helix-turn-helix YgiT family protein